mgnify:CR=1 FL=1
MDEIDLSELEDQFDEIDTTGDIVVSELDDLTLIRTFHAQKDLLLKLQEVLHPRTQAGRDAHSLYAACKIELDSRITKGKF